MLLLLIIVERILPFLEVNKLFAISKRLSYVCFCVLFHLFQLFLFSIQRKSQMCVCGIIISNPF